MCSTDGTPLFEVASLTELYTTTARKILTDTAAEAQKLNRRHPDSTRAVAARVEAFALVRLLLLHSGGTAQEIRRARDAVDFAEGTPAPQGEEADEVLDSTHHRLTRATLNFVEWRASLDSGTNSSPPLFVVPLRSLMRRADDEYVRAQAAVLLAQTALHMTGLPTTPLNRVLQPTEGSWAEEATDVLTTLTQQRYPLTTPSLRAVTEALTACLQGAHRQIIGHLGDSTNVSRQLQLAEIETHDRLDQTRTRVALALAATGPAQYRLNQEAINALENLERSDVMALSSAEQNEIAVMIGHLFVAATLPKIARQVRRTARRTARRRLTRDQLGLTLVPIVIENWTQRLILTLWPESTAPPPVARTLARVLELSYHELEDPDLIVGALNFRVNAFEHAEAGEKSIDAIDGLRAAQKAVSATLQTDLADSLRHFAAEVDRLIPRGHRYRNSIIAEIGEAMSTLVGLGQADEADLDRCVDAYEENLFAVQSGHLRGEAQAEDLRTALRSAAVSRNLRYRFGSQDQSDPQKQSDDLQAAVRHSRRAVAISPEDDPLTILTLSWLLNIENRQIHTSPDRNRTATEALNLQRRGLQAYFSGEFEEQDQAGALAKLVFPVTPEIDATGYRLVQDIFSEAMGQGREPAHSLSAAAKGSRLALMAADYAEAVQFVQNALDRTESVTLRLKTQEPQQVLSLIQGMSSLGAYAAAKLGRIETALQLLERGAAQRARNQLGRTSRIAPGMLKLLAGTMAAPVVYLAAGPAGGIALLLSPDREVTFIDLPALTDSQVDQFHLILRGESDLIRTSPESHGVAGEWLESKPGTPGTPLLVDVARRSERLEPDSIGRGPTDASVRGPRGSIAPGTEDLKEVIERAADAVWPLRELLAKLNPTEIHLIPVGTVAGLPWHIALATGALEAAIVTTNPSATLLDASARRLQPRGRGAVIAAATPTRFDGSTYPDLPGARAEGEWLRDHIGAEGHIGTAADAEAFRQVTKAPRNYIHVAVHGAFDPNDWEGARLLWAAPDNNSESPTTSVTQITAAPAALVYLGCCWGAASARSVPDEALSFPTALLAAGTSQVIAPLWPVEDDAAQFIATHFYDLWQHKGEDPAAALRHACQKLRTTRRFARTAAWAAFTITGFSRRLGGRTAK